MRFDMLVLILGMGLITSLTRVPFFLMFSRRELSPRTERLLRHVPVALLAAIVAPVFTMPGGLLLPPMEDPYLLGAAVTLLAARFTRNVIVLVSAGVLCVAVVRARWLPDARRQQPTHPDTTGLLDEGGTRSFSIMRL